MEINSELNNVSFFVVLYILYFPPYKNMPVLADPKVNIKLWFVLFKHENELNFFFTVFKICKHRTKIYIFVYICFDYDCILFSLLPCFVQKKV